MSSKKRNYPVLVPKSKEHNKDTKDRALPEERVYYEFTRRFEKKVPNPESEIPNWLAALFFIGKLALYVIFFIIMLKLADYAEEITSNPIVMIFNFAVNAIDAIFILIIGVSLTGLIVSLSGGG